VVNLFDELQIITTKGALTERDLNSPMIVHLVAYLLLHGKRNNQPQEIFQTLWPDADNERANVKVKSIVYRFQQMFNLICDHRLIEYVGGSYRINPELNVMTDLDMFTDSWNQAAVSSDLVTKGHTLKKAMDIYKNGLLPAHSSEHWLMPIAAHYSLRYIGVINQLLATLDLAHDYVCIHEYAGIAVQAVPGSADAHYWLIYAMQHLGTPEIANKQLEAAKQLLTEEYYNDLLTRLGKTSPGQTE
jgi:DNA-binding SARP family transcriptional activator